MAKLHPANLAPDALPRLRGTFITYINKFGVIAAKWPTKRGPPTNWNVYWTSQQFAIASRLAANSEPLQQQTAVYLTQGTNWLPRDLLVRAAFGKAYEVYTPDGTLMTQASHAPPPDPSIPVWSVAAAATLTAEQTGWQGYSMRQRIAAAYLTGAGGQASRVSFRAGNATGVTTILSAYIGKAAPTGNAWNYASTPTQLMFAGSPSIVIPQGATAVSDQGAYCPAPGEDLMMSFALGSPSGIRYATVQAGWQNFYKIGNDPGVTAPSGYAPLVPVITISQVEFLA